MNNKKLYATYSEAKEAVNKDYSALLLVPEALKQNIESLMKLAIDSIDNLERNLNLLEVDAKISQQVVRRLVEIIQYIEFNRLFMHRSLLSEQKEAPRVSILQLIKDIVVGRNISNLNKYFCCAIKV